MLLSTSTSTSSDGLGTGFLTPLSRSISTASSFASRSLKSLELDDEPGACVFNQFYSHRTVSAWPLEYDPGNVCVSEVKSETSR